MEAHRFGVDVLFTLLDYPYYYTAAMEYFFDDDIFVEKAADAAPGNTNQPPKVRQNFPETWLWSLLTR